MPKGDTAPEIWMLGSSSYGAQVAAHFGLPYSFAWFFTNGRGGQEALDLYRIHYRPSVRHPGSVAGICVWALAAGTEEEAQRSEEHTSELQSLMRISYAVFCLKKKKHKTLKTR